MKYFESINEFNEADENIVSVAMGDVDYLPNGNILAAYGALVSDVTQWTMIREFERTNPENVVGNCVWSRKTNKAR